MAEIWQNAIIMVAVAGALAYLVIRLVRWRRRRRACSQCQLIQAVTGGKNGDRTESSPN